MLVLLPWLQVIGVYAWIPLAVLEGLFYGLAGLAARAVVRLPDWPLWAATAWVLVEALRAVVPFGGFPWGRLAFATEDTPVAATFAYLGAPGATFVVALLGTTLAWAVLRFRRTPLRAVVGVAVAAGLACLASVVPYDAGRGPTVTVAAVQGNVPGKGLEAFAERRAVLDNHVEATLELADRVDAGTSPRPDLVVWPENSSDIDPYADAGARAEIGQAAQAVGVPAADGRGRRRPGRRGLVQPGDRVVAGRAAGEVLRQDPPGAVRGVHPAALVPRAADPRPASRSPATWSRGTRPGVLRVGPATAGVLMCFEVAYDGLLRDLVDGGADVIVVPTNNATYTGTGQIEQQFAMSRLRAIETGRYVVVASTNGISGIVAPDGHVVERAPSQRAGRARAGHRAGLRTHPGDGAGSLARAGARGGFRDQRPGRPRWSAIVGARRARTAIDEDAGAEPAHEHR